MLYYISDFTGTDKEKQLRKLAEEVSEFSVEVARGNNEKADQEGADIIQTVLTYWATKGYNIEDIEGIFNRHYKKEADRGRKIESIGGISYTNGVIRGLLNKIIQLEKEVRMLKMVLDND